MFSMLLSIVCSSLAGITFAFISSLIVFLFVALFARLNFVVPNHLLEQTLGYAAIFCGALLWWACLTAALKSMKARFQMETIKMFNRLLGALVMCISGILVILTLIGKL